MKKLLALITAFAFLASGVAVAHQPVVLLNTDTTAAKGPLLVDGTVSFAIRAAFNKTGEKKAFRAQFKEGEALAVQYLIVDKKPENTLKNSQLPTVVITGPGGFKTTMKINERTTFYETYGRTNYLYLARFSTVTKAGIYSFVITAKTKSAITVAVGEKEIKGEVVRGPYVAPTPTPTPTPVVTPTPTPVVTPTPTSSPTPTPTPTPSPVVTPTPTPTPTPIELTFSNIAENVDAIALNVYSKYQKLMATNYQSSIKVNTIIGPNTVPVNKNSASAYQIASKIFQNFKQPDEVFAIYYNFADKEWARNEVAIRAGKFIADFQFGYSCPNAKLCWGASASVTEDWQAIAHFGASDPGGAIHGAEFNGEIQIHEYTHSVSFYQLKPIKGNYYNLTPDWFGEGHASVTGKLGASTSFEDYTVLRSEAIRRNRPQPDIKDYRPENILRFYDAFSKAPEPSTIERFYLYTLGWSTVEALAAIGGIDSPMNLFLETVNGLTFKQAFKKVYELEWEIAAPILAEVVSKQYRTFYP